MVYRIAYSRSSLFWFLIHAGLGVMVAFSPWPLIAWFYFVAITSGTAMFQPSVPNRLYSIAMVISYMTSFELIARISNAFPYVPYEVSKYMMFFLLILGIFSGANKERNGILMLFMILPSFLFADSDEVYFLEVVFNGLGAINVALAIIFFSSLSLSFDQFKKLLKLMLYPMFAALVCTFIKTPDLDSIQFSLGANAAASGGFGPNQVSTVIGLGMFLIFIFWIFDWRWSGNRLLDAGILVFFVFQGLLTFSRGGMLGGALGVIMLTVMTIFIDRKYRIRNRIPDVRKYLIPGFILIAVTFITVNEITGGNLALRYAGETVGTMKGTKDKDFNVITTSRYKIFNGDLKLWAENPIFGVGVAASKHLRENTEDITAHIEASRLLAEHGSFGLAYIILLVLVGFNILRKNKNVILRSILFIFFSIGVYTTFHSALRTFVTPLIVGVGCSNVVYNPATIRRQRKEDVDLDMMALAGSNTNESSKV
jgi:uncharacterized membrane protein